MKRELDFGLHRLSLLKWNLTSDGTKFPLHLPPSLPQIAMQSYSKWSQCDASRKCGSTNRDYRPTPPFPPEEQDKINMVRYSKRMMDTQTETTPPPPPKEQVNQISMVRCFKRIVDPHRRPASPHQKQLSNRVVEALENHLSTRSKVISI